MVRFFFLFFAVFLAFGIQAQDNVGGQQVLTREWSSTLYNDNLQIPLGNIVIIPSGENMLPKDYYATIRLHSPLDDADDYVLVNFDHVGQTKQVQFVDVTTSHSFVFRVTLTENQVGDAVRKKQTPNVSDVIKGTISATSFTVPVRAVEN